MGHSEITIARQIETLSGLISKCRDHQSELARIQGEIRELQLVHDEEMSSIEKASHTSLEFERQRLTTTQQNDLATLKVDCESQVASLRNSLEVRLREIDNTLNEKVGSLEEQRRSEIWVLQSVLDEENSDSPVAGFDREAETFVTQKAFLDERFNSIREQLEDARGFLSDCHAAIDSPLPEPQPVTGGREKLRDIAVESGDLVVAEVDRLRKLMVPHWIRGGRIWALSALIFLLTWIPVIALKADLREFLNPELGKPNFEWAGVSAVIALVVTLMASLITLFTTQSKLRGHFVAASQNLSNGQKAGAVWEQKSERHIEKLDAAAAHWRKQMEQRRRDLQQKVENETNTKILNLRLESENAKGQITADAEQRIQAANNNVVEAERLLETRLQTNLQELESRFALQLQSELADCRMRFETATMHLRSDAEILLNDWNVQLQELRTLAQDSNRVAAATREWPVEGWQLPDQMPDCISVGDFRAVVPQAPDNQEVQTAACEHVELPAVLRFPTDTSIVVEHDSAGRETALSFLRSQILKLMTVIPAGRVRLTLIDPVGLGQSFSAMMHLTDFDELLIHSRIWTDGQQIRDQLQKVTEHMENIFQTYLRSQFETIEEYNASAGEVAEPYHFVVVAGFPTAFSEEAARHLSSVLTSGPRCGVHALIAWNPAVGAPPSFDTDDLVNHCLRFRVQDEAVLPFESLDNDVSFKTYPPLPSDEYVKLVREVGEQSKDARRVEVSFNRISPAADDVWAGSTADGIDLPIGRAGAARLQFMRLGRGTSQHVLIAGKTGSGKSTFLHILITNLALHYAPDEIQFYLIDFKKGVEFRTYAANKLPHARVVAIESDREFGLSVLERLDEILQERGDLFRERGVQDVPSFREQFPAEPMPRLLLLIDEFQEFFVAEDRVSSRASLLLDRLVRQGRAFGIHVMLGSQTLGGAYSLARSTMGQIAVRIALQCSESDAHLILSEDNMAARTLTRPGEAIYNDANGLVQGNHQFQIAWLDESQREEAIKTMVELQKSAAADSDYGMVVFEGNVSPTMEFCAPLNAHLTASEDVTRRPTDAVMTWVGEPVSIAAPTSIELRRASGQNVLIVGQDEPLADGILSAMVLCISGKALQRERSVPKVTLLHDGRDPEVELRYSDLVAGFGQSAVDICESAECDSVVAELLAEVELREQGAEKAQDSEVVLVVRDLGQFRSLRKEEDDFGLGKFGEPKTVTTAAMFADILKRGPVVGVHVVVWSDTFSNAVRSLSNALLREFESRIALRMNQTDSASLIDTPVAAGLGPGRAILYRDQTGTIEKFRPFAWPSEHWLKAIVGSENAGNDFDIDSLHIE